MSFLVKFIDPETLDAMMELPRVIALDSTKLNAEGIFNTFNAYMTEKKIPFKNVLAVSCDNASVMIGDLNYFKTFTLKENPSILFIPCICHRLALVAKDSCKKIPGYIEPLLQSIVRHMNSTKRLEAFNEISSSVQGTSKKILDFAKTRWLGRHDCIERVRELYPSLLLHFTELCFSEKNNASFQKIKVELDDPRTKAYLAFLQYVLKKFNVINLFFQHEETKVHLLNSKCITFLKTIASHFLKSALLRDLAHSKIDFRSSDNQKPLDMVDLGPDCNDIIDELSQNLEANTSVIQEIRENCLAFYVETVSQILDRLYYIKDEFFKNLSVLDLSNTDIGSSFEKVSYLADKFGLDDKDALKTEWRQVLRRFSLRAETSYSLITFDEMWKDILSCKNVDGNVIFPHLKVLVGYIRSLPHSNAAAERTFSLLPDISTKKRNSLSNESINALAVVKSANKLNTSLANTEMTEDQLSLMSSSKLYEPPKKKTHLLNFHADTTDNYEDIKVFEAELIDTVLYKQWTSVDRTNLEIIQSTGEELLVKLETKLKALVTHAFIAQQQSAYFSERKEQLQPGECLVVCDFAENYAFEIQDAIQGVHWNNDQATLHPFVGYYKEGGRMNHKNYIAISESLKHDTVVVHLFQRNFVNFLKQYVPGLNKIIYFSDGASAQYKNKKNFLNVCLHEEDFGVSAEWNFFATSHGKGPCDGIGGALKRLATRAKVFEAELIDTVLYKQWTSVDRTNLEIIQSTGEELLVKLETKLKALVTHAFIAQQQSAYFSERKEQLQPGECLVVCDFAENYAFEIQDAIQGVHWNNDQATLHPFVGYYKEGGRMNHKNYIAISESLKHDTVVVHLFQRNFVNFLKQYVPGLNKIIYFSDGASAQYKNKKNFLNVCLHEEDFGVSAEWNFFATSHGKGPCDGIGGALKRLATRATEHCENACVVGGDPIRCIDYKTGVVAAEEPEEEADE
ncbi:unnamed protein product [Brassicogethes aeneus]|uniref:Uncharacterized protein n=1 Tax=Brassicogethes aeneus TaxID=1431903 RepID=A0A9P0BE86_BRAAE|nr:unnamed protein product [Brassicogethes aeneus]